MHAAGCSWVGRREQNEDVYACVPDLKLYIVADGMGGHAGGEVASQLATDSFIRHIQRRSQSLEAREDQIVSEAVRAAARVVARRAVGPLAEMGTTLAALWFHNDCVVVTHVGDSRIYRLRDGELEQLTLDHSLLAEVKARNPNAVLSEYYSGVVTRCIGGYHDSADPDIQMFQYEEDDVFLLCSDGLTDVLSLDDIREALSSTESPNDAVIELNRRAFQAGSEDNITSVVVRCGEEVDLASTEILLDELTSH